MHRGLAKYQIFSKLAHARFDACMREHGYDPVMIKEALFAGESSVNYRGNPLAKSFSTMKDHLVRGTSATKATTAPGLLSSPKDIKKWVKKTDAAGAPGLMRRLGNTGARGFNRLFAGMSALELGEAALSKRKAGEGLFESMGRRGGQAANALSLYLPGRLGLAASGLMFGELFGLPGLKGLGSKAGRAIDAGVSKLRGAGTAARRFFGGSKSQSARDDIMKALKSRAGKSSVTQGNKFNMKAHYQ